MAGRDGSSAAAERLSPGCKARIFPRRAHLVDGVPCASLSVTPSFATDHGAHNPATTAARPCSKSVRIEGPVFALGFITQGSALRATEQFCPVSALALLTRLAHTTAPTAHRLHQCARIQAVAANLRALLKRQRPEACGLRAWVASGLPEDW